MIFIIILGLGTIVTLLIGMPIAFSLGVAGSISVLTMGVPLEIIPMKICYGLNNFPLLCVPFFILAGEFMAHGKITEVLLKFAVTLIGFVRGGLALANVLASMFFGGMTGSALADVSALGSVEIPMMIKNGYDNKFSAAITCASACIGPIIPPSNPAVIYAVAVGTSIGGLFLAGAIPGILIGIALMCGSYFISVKRQYPKSKKSSLKEIFMSFKDAILALVLPIIIIGGIVGGIFTPTEASAVAVGYAFFITVIVNRTVKLSDLPEMLLQTVITTSVVMIIVGTSTLFAWVMAMNRVGVMIEQLFAFCTPLTFLMLVNLLLLILGTFMDIIPLILIFAPILAPISVNLGINPLHFGMIFCINGTLGLITPPLGEVLFVASPIAKVTVEELSIEIFPLFLIEVGVLLLVTYVPSLTLWLPKLMGFL